MNCESWLPALRRTKYKNTYGCWSYDDMKPILLDARSYGRKRIMLNTSIGHLLVKASSIRLGCFLLDPKCASCDCVGTIFALQAQDCEWPHLNLYAIDTASQNHSIWSARGKMPATSNDRLILMTKDHIIPKSKGGPTEYDNLQTMCITCNIKKGDKI